MGKWTPDGIDYVLAGKIKTVVDSVNARIRLDAEPSAPPAQPTITYDQFVEELDLGDSFTSVLFECLVKEMADRRKRKSNADKRMISRRTQKLLENLSHSTRVLRDRTGDDGRLAFRRNMYTGSGWGGSAGVDLEGTSDFSTWLNELPDDDGRTQAFGGDDSDDLWAEDAMDAHLSPPGARELHDAYYPGSRLFSRPTRWPTLPSRTTLEDSDWSLPTIYRTASAGNTPGATASTSAGGNTQGTESASGATVTRQASLRRTGRQRLDAFNDFATRRRVNTRLDAETSTAADRAEAASALAAYHAGSVAAAHRGWDTAPPPWTVSAGVSTGTTSTAGPSISTSSARLLSGTSRLRRLQQLQAQAHMHAQAAAAAAAGASAAVASTSAASSVAGTPDPSSMYILRSVSPTPPVRVGGPPPPVVGSGATAMASRGVGTETGEGGAQLLTPRSTTPAEEAPIMIP